MTNNYRYSPSDPDYRRVHLLNYMLVVSIIVFTVFTILNIFIFTSIYLVILNIVAVIISCSVLFYFHKLQKLETTALITISFLILTLLIYFNIKEYEDYALYWIAVVPPVAYFLLGKKKGRIITLTFLGYMTFFILNRFQGWVQESFTTDSIYNIIIASLVIKLVISYYELSREEAFIALKSKNDELTKLSTHDTLTGLYNRFKLDQVLDYEVNRGIRSNESFSVILGDLDRFKFINDTYGHLKGDYILVKIAGIIKDSCRQTDTVGRWGGEEFLIICPNTNLRGAVTLAEKIRSKIENYQFEGIEQVTISLGVTSYSTGDTIEMIIKNADRALYNAKENSRNKVEHYINQGQTP